jgi:AAA15 family ATPase/GTPase
LSKSNNKAIFCVIFAKNGFIMLVQFTVKNFACFKERVTLSMVASRYDQSTRWQDNVIEVPKFNLNLLRSAVIYGANASGKTKLLHAMGFMDYLVRSSYSASKDKRVNEQINVTPFKLNNINENTPSLFEITFIHKKEMYRYGFEVTTKEVVSEWFYHRKTTKEILLFERNYQTFNDLHTKFKKGKVLVDNKMVKRNTLLLSAAAQFDEALAQAVFDWFSNFNTLSGLQDERYAGISMGMLDEKEFKKDVMQFIQGADLNITDLKAIKMSLADLPKAMPKKLKDSLTQKVQESELTIYSDVSVTHKKYDADNNFIGNVEFSLDDEESSGTRKYFAFSAPIIQTLKEGEVTAIDELDAKLHPNLVSKIVALFNSKETNPKNAQLIFNTHDTNLLSAGLFRRDQIWFTEKDRYGAATLYSLNDFKKEDGGKARNKENYELNYVEGKYGAVPYLGDFDKIFRPQNDVVYENEK